MTKADLKKRLRELQKRIDMLLPKPDKPPLRIIVKYEKPEDGDKRPTMIMSRPGERVKDLSRDNFTITIVDPNRAHADAIKPDLDPEPDDAHLEDAIAELERKLVGVKDD